MGNYSKLIGSIIGALSGFLVSNFGFPAELATPEIVAGVTAVASAVFTYFFPANSAA